MNETAIKNATELIQRASGILEGVSLTPVEKIQLRNTLDLLSQTTHIVAPVIVPKTSNKEKKLQLTITNGNDYCYADDGVSSRNYPNLKELEIVEKWVVENRAKIINKQKDEANKLKFSTSGSGDLVINNANAILDSLVLQDGKQFGIWPKSKDAIRITWNKHIPNELMVTGYNKTGKEINGTIKIDWNPEEFLG